MLKSVVLTRGRRVRGLIIVGGAFRERIFREISSSFLFGIIDRMEALEDNRERCFYPRIEELHQYAGPICDTVGIMRSGNIPQRYVMRQDSCVGNI